MRRWLSKRSVVTAAVVVTTLALFAWEWAAAPRVHVDENIRAQLVATRGDLYLGETFEGLPLRSVRPFLYSDCAPGRQHPLPCRMVLVRDGRIAGTDSAQVVRARRKLRRVA